MTVQRLQTRCNSKFCVGRHRKVLNELILQAQSHDDAQPHVHFEGTDSTFEPGRDLGPWWSYGYTPSNKIIGWLSDNGWGIPTQ